MPKLTKRLVDQSSPEEKEQFIWDSDLKGFGLRVSPKGRKTYILQYRHGGRTKRLSLGTHGALAPDQARDLAKSNLGNIAGGSDPSGDRKRDRFAPTLSSLCDRFINDYVPTRCKPRTQSEYKRCCDLFIKPELGMYRVQDVTRTEISKLHHKLKDKPYQANRVLGVLSKMFNLAEIWGLRPDGSNPTRHVEKYPEKKRERFLSPEEIQILWQTLDECVDDESETHHVATAFKLLLLTGCRLSEIQTLKWDYIRDDVIWLPDAKTGPRRVLLSSEAIALLQKTERMENNPYIIVGTIDGQHVTDLQKPWRRIRTKANLEGVRIHDLRHTYASIAAMAGHSLPMIGKLLGHTQTQTTARYAHLADQTTRSAVNVVDNIFKGFTSCEIDEAK